MGVNVISGGVIALVGMYFLVLGFVALLIPGRASSFLLGFASSAPKHYLELMLRFAAGFAFVSHAPLMRFPPVVYAFGWVLVGTTAVMLVIPWRWHEAFAKRSVPSALRFVRLIGVSSLILGGFVLYGLVGPASS